MSDYNIIEAMNDWADLEGFYDKLYDTLNDDQHKEYAKYSEQVDKILLAKEHSNEDFERLYTVLGQMAQIMS